MSIAHLGLALSVFGITMVKSYEVERDISLGAGASATLGQYVFHVAGFHPVEGPNYHATEGEVIVTKNNEQIAVLRPQKRVYRVRIKVLRRIRIDLAMHQDIGRDYSATGFHCYDSRKIKTLPKAGAYSSLCMAVQQTQLGGQHTFQ